MQVTVTYTTSSGKQRTATADVVSTAGMSLVDKIALAGDDYVSVQADEVEDCGPELQAARAAGITDLKFVIKWLKWLD